MLLINCEVNLILTCSSTFVITNCTGAGRFKITDTNLYVPIVTLSTQDIAKLFLQLKSGFKQFIGTNINQIQKICTKPIFKSFSRFKFSRSKQAFCIIF